MAIIVWFFIGLNSALLRPDGTPHPKAAFCTAPESATAAQHRLFDAGGINDRWQLHKTPGLTPPNVITSDHPNYAAAIAECKPWQG